MKHKVLSVIILLMLGLTTGLFAQAHGLDFDGNDNVAMGDLGFIGTSYTAECWIYPTSLPTSAYANTILASSSAYNTYPMWFGTYNSEIRVWSYTQTNTDFVSTSGLGLAINTWYHVAVTTTKGGNTKLYVNGVQKLSYTNSGIGDNWTPIFTVGDLRPGRGLGFRGKILDVRVWNTVITQAQILAGMFNDLSGTETGLIGYWPMNEGSGVTVYDIATAPHHNGTLGTVASTEDPAWTVGITPYVDLASANPAVTATNVAQGTTKLPLHRFSIKANVLTATISQVVFTTTGTYIDSDIVNYKLWYSTTNDLSGAANIGSTVTTSLGTGDHTFSGLSQNIAAGVTGYFWITADTSPTATPGATIKVAAITPSQITLVFGFKTGFTSAGGDQTFDETLPVELSSFTAIPTAEYFVRLNWVTQSETGVSGFKIYRGRNNDLAEATDMNVFIEATNTGTTQMYSYVDNELTGDGTYYYWLQNIDLDGGSRYYGPVTATVSQIGGGDTPPIVVVAGIEKIYPNPFNPQTNIRINLLEEASVEVVIFNVRGQKVRNLLSAQKTAGFHNLEWNGLDNSGASCSSGVYTVRVKIGTEVYSKQMVMSK